MLCGHLCPACLVNTDLLVRLCAAAGSRNGKENARKGLPAALAGEDSRSLVRPSSAKRKLEKLGSLKQSTLSFAKKPAPGRDGGAAAKGSAAKAEAPKPAAPTAPVANSSDDELIITESIETIVID